MRDASKSNPNTVPSFRERLRQWNAAHLRPDWKWQLVSNLTLCICIALITALLLNFEIGKCR